MRALAASLDSFHKEQVRGGLGLYFVEDELRREVDWVNFLDSDDYFWQERVWREAVARAEVSESSSLFTGRADRASTFNYLLNNRHGL
jgi:hypothetical protein